MKAILEFNLPEDREEYESCIKGQEYYNRIENIWEVCFRPYWKYGFQDKKMNDILETEDGQYLMEKLIELYQSTKED